MKTTLLCCALLVSTLAVNAQNEKKQSTVRIKKVENVNGVETVTDTTYTTNNPPDIKMEEVNFDPKMLEGKQFVVKKARCGASQSEIDSVTEEIYITIIKRIDISDANEEDMKRLGKQNGVVDNKLQMDNMNMSPNPSNGKFDLNFNLKNKGDAEVTVYNMEGKQVYNEKISGFQGEYKKTLDLSNNNKGIYFVKIQQDKHTQVKKVIIE